MQSDRLQCFAIAAPGIEQIVATELRQLSANPVVVPGGVEFDADAALLYSANLHLRCAARVVVRIASFRARTFFELERHARRVQWSEYVGSGGAVALRVTSRKSKLYHEGAIAERLMKAIGQSVGSVQPAHAVSDEEESNDAAGQMFVVRFMRDECVISADASGALLHLRGYRRAVARAPLRETLAASMLSALDWRGASPLLDPMCGSGTIPIEAALIARRIAPGLANERREPRRYAFEEWPTFDAAAWRDVVARAQADVTPSAGVPIVGSDRDAGAITAATANAVRAGVADDVQFVRAALSDAPVPDERAWLVTNPPYGVRVGGGDVRDLFAATGRLVRDCLPAGRAAFLTPESHAAAHTALRLEPVFTTSNGGIAVSLLATQGRADNR